VLPSCPWLSPGYRVFARSGPSAVRKNHTGILSWACALLQSASKLQRPPPPRRRSRRNARATSMTAAPPMRFAPLQRLPARDSGLMTGFASPDRLHLRVFSTSWRLDPPRACRPCFMPDPLLGLRPPELCSSRAAVRRLRRLSPHVVWMNPSSPPHRCADLCARPARRCRNSAARDPNAGPVRGPELTGSDEPAEASPPSGVCSSRESATSRRRIRSTRARSSPGLFALQGSPPHDNGSTFAGPPLMGFLSSDASGR
jgi:hypothetical protein